jgi:hypothetical protein
MSKNVDFSETHFSQGKRVGLRLYTDYMISKNGCDWFQWGLTCFALKMEFFWKSNKERQTLWFYDFVIVGRWNAHVYSTALICDLSVYIVDALEFIYLVLVNCFNCFEVAKW